MTLEELREGLLIFVAIMGGFTHGWYSGRSSLRSQLRAKEPTP